MTEKTTKVTAVMAAVAVAMTMIVKNNVVKVATANADKMVYVEESHEPIHIAATGESSVSWGEDTLEPIYSCVEDTESLAACEVLETPVSEKWYSDEFISNNKAIKDYADKYATFTFNGVVIDGLAVMAQANTESCYMADRTQTLTALYPSTFVPFTGVEDITTCDVTKIWGNSESLNGTYSDINRFYTTGPLYAWSSGDGVYEQGPLQQRVITSSVTEDLVSEYDKLANAGIIDSLYNTIYGYEALSYCTGGSVAQCGLGYNEVGDRWAIKDNCLIWKDTKYSQLERLWDYYYEDCGYTPNKYEYLAILAYCHWIPSVIAGDCSEETARYYGFSYDGSWFKMAHQLSSSEAISIIRNHVYADIDANRELYYSGEYTKEEAMAMFCPIITAGSRTYVEDSEPWKIYNELVDAGIVDSSLVITHPEYPYQHAMKYAICYLYAYEMLDILLMEEY